MALTRRSLVQALGLSPLLFHLPACRAAWPEDQPERMRILVLGGLQFVGPSIVSAALARGHEVTLFNRGRSQATSSI